MLVSSSDEHFKTWKFTKFEAHQLPVENIASVAFNTDMNTISVVFQTTKVSVTARRMNDTLNTVVFKK